MAVLNRREAIAAAIGAAATAVLPESDNKPFGLLQHVHSSLHIYSKGSDRFYLIGWDGEKWKRILGPFSQEKRPGSVHVATEKQGLLVAFKGTISCKGVPPCLDNMSTSVTAT